MILPFNTAMEEVDGVLKKHGIGSFIIVLKDPDSDTEVRNTNGSWAWIGGHGQFLAALAEKKYNSEE